MSTPRRRFVGANLRLVSQSVWRDIVDGVYAAGYDDLTPAHIGIFRYPGTGGLRPSEIAANLAVTKQSVNDLLGELERKGYLTRKPDPADRRARVVTLTPRGEQLERDIRKLAKQAEDRIAHLLGPKRFAQFTGALEVLVAEQQG
jgi:DNA-binding MarR family transcriptional regulator